MRTIGHAATLTIRALVVGLSAAGDQWAVGLGCDRSRR